MFSFAKIAGVFIFCVFSSFLLVTNCILSFLLSDFQRFTCWFRFVLLFVNFFFLFFFFVAYAYKIVVVVVWSVVVDKIQSKKMSPPADQAVARKKSVAAPSSPF